MDTTPLPNREGDLSDSDSLSTGSLSLSWYVVRVTPHDKFTFDELFSFLQKEYQISQFVIGRETTPQEHFHIVLSVDCSLELQDVKDIIRAFIVPKWTGDNGKCPKGFGNKQYNCQLAEDKDLAVSYAVKCKEIKYEGFEESYIKERMEASFEKKKPSNFKSEYIDLCKLFQETSMEPKDFMIAYVLLKAKYGQSVRVSDAYGYAMSNLVQRSPEEAEELVENYLYKL